MPYTPNGLLCADDERSPLFLKGGFQLRDHEFPCTTVDGAKCNAHLRRTLSDVVTQDEGGQSKDQAFPSSEKGGQLGEQGFGFTGAGASNGGVDGFDAGNVGHWFPPCSSSGHRQVLSVSAVVRLVNRRQ
ncbi:hypothetical protein D9M69_697750 [compost metagenome]